MWKWTRRILIAVNVLALGALALGLFLFMWANLRPVPMKIEPQPAVCSATDTLARVYHPFRLVVFEHCLVVEGVVQQLKYENDGDVHIRLQLDPRYRYAINLGNRLFAAGDLVVEIVCVNAVALPCDPASCQGYSNSVLIPGEGEHVLVIGQHVLDLFHGWNEIHPAYSVTRSGGLSVKKAN